MVAPTLAHLVDVDLDSVLEVPIHFTSGCLHWRPQPCYDLYLEPCQKQHVA